MFRSALRAVVVLSALLIAGPVAAAEGSQPPLLQVHSDGSVSLVRDSLPKDITSGTGGDVQRPATNRARAAASPAVPYTIKRMLAAKHITQAQATAALDAWTQAVRTRRTLSGLPREELGNVIAIVTGITNRKAFAPSRINSITLLLKRNTEFFGARRVPAYHQRVQFDGSDIVWQYYPGQGMQIQVLATFGVANGLWRVHLNGHFRALLDEMNSLASYRAGGKAWEYMFNFDGGSPPWTSAMSQATGIQAMARGAQRLQEPKYLKAARDSLTIFSKRTPSGVLSNTSNGPWYVMYSFDGSGRIFNGFLQTLIGLHELVLKANDATAQKLFSRAEPVARRSIPNYMSSGWSFYEPGEWSSESYHELTTGFLGELCTRTKKTAYCEAEKAFAADTANPPRLAVATKSLKAGKPATLRFWVSKPATVSVAVKDGNRTLRRTSGTFDPGFHRLAGVKAPKGSKSLAVVINGSDPAGKKRRIISTVQVKR